MYYIYFLCFGVASNSKETESEKQIKKERESPERQSYRKKRRH